MKYEMIRNAKVAVEAREIETRKGNVHVHAVITINDRHQHEFHHESRISKALGLMSPKDLATKLSGGHYFLVGDELIDFREGPYVSNGGFVHDDKAIKALVKVLGFMDSSDIGKGARTFKGNTLSGDILLGKRWSDHGIVVPGYKEEGGKFSSQLLFGWNPFVKNVHSMFQLIRLICLNGAIGLTSFLNTKIPLVNRWEEHLEIANKQIQNKVEAISQRRFTQMLTERATVAEVTALYTHAFKRRVHATKEGYRTAEERLQQIIDIVNPNRHLSGVYTDNVFNDSRMAAQCQAHLTTFDAYNIATEIRTHSEEVSESTDHALDRIANRMLFDREDLTAYVDRSKEPRLSAFSDANHAFFGKLH